MAQTAIFLAPNPGTTGVVPLADVQHAAELVGLGDFDAEGLATVRVARASTLVDAAVLAPLIDAGLAERGIVYSGVTADIRFDRGDIGFNATVVPQPATLQSLRYTPGNGAFAARFSIAGLDQPVDLSGRIELMTTTPRLSKTLPAGAILDRSDFEMASVPLATADAGGFAAIDQLVGKQLLHQSRLGVMLRPGDVDEPTVVSRNDLVTVYLHSGAMTLTVKGTALGTVAAGEPVVVLNVVTRKILHGVARPDGSVEIVTATTVASL
jgi:flagella basal body P-ring formation protein FlgA